MRNPRLNRTFSPCCVLVIAQGYEDANYSGTLTKDQAFKIMTDQTQGTAFDLTSQPDLSRFKN